MAQNALAELRIPADEEYIPVAKRVASSLGSKLGFSLEELDELCIAVTQACGSAIEASVDSWGDGASIKLSFASTQGGIAVDVQAMAPRAPHSLVRSHQRPQVPAQVDDVQRLALEMIRCFVDDFRSQRNSSRIRYRMVKYLLT
jgi:serine/threonine-protein kinase RsbW